MECGTYCIQLHGQMHMWLIPATANVIGKIYAGIADDMLTTTIMATKAPKYLCPAMNTEMYNNPITQRNLEGLRSLGLPYYGTCGRMAWLVGLPVLVVYQSPEAIVDWLESQMCKSNELEGITACLLQPVDTKRISILFVILVIGLVERWGMPLQQAARMGG